MRSSHRSGHDPTTLSIKLSAVRMALYVVIASKLISRTFVGKKNVKIVGRMVNRTFIVSMRTNINVWYSRRRLNPTPFDGEGFRLIISTTSSVAVTFVGTVFHLTRYYELFVEEIVEIVTLATELSYD